MSNPSISVAMATFNGARYLGEQLTSLSPQTVKPLELVVCDDGSTDETVAILQSFSALAPFTVRIFQNAERLGYQQNFIKEKQGYIRQSLVQHRIHGNNTSGWVTGGKATLQRLLRGFRLPPYANGTDLNAFIAQFVGPANLVYRDAVQRCKWW